MSYCTVTTMMMANVTAVYLTAHRVNKYYIKAQSQSLYKSTITHHSSFT